MRRLSATALALVTALSFPARSAETSIVSLDLAFNVWNVNRSLIPCPTDLGHYRIRGTLLAREDVLAQPSAERSITLLLHGGTAGAWVFHLPAEGIDFAGGLARRGHAVVVIDRLGFDRSRTDDAPFGYLTCIGGEADIASQIVDELRRGDYTAAGGPGPAFGKVALFGHSQGGAITMVEAYSFGSADAYLPTGWSRFRAEKAVQIGAHVGPQCMTGGGPSEYDGSGPRGYADEWPTAQQQVDDVYWTPQPLAVVELIHRLRNRDGCGFISSLVEEAALDAVYSPLVEKPVLLVFGAEDELLDPTSFERQRDGYIGTPNGKADLVLIPDAGHLFYLENSAKAEESQDRVSFWLAANGL